MSQETQRTPHSRAFKPQALSAQGLTSRVRNREAQEEGRGGNNGASGGKQSLETPLSISPAGNEQAGRPHTLQALCRVRMLGTSRGPPDRGAHSSPEGGTGPRMAVGSQGPRKGLAHRQAAAPLPKRPRSELEVMSVRLPPPRPP